MSVKIFNKPILITGSHRSGTTWVGRILSISPSIGYIHEPFNPLHRRLNPGICKAKFKYQYMYVTDENESEFYNDILRTIKFRYNFLLQLKEVIKKRKGYRTLVRQASSFLMSRYIYDARPLFKDPMALFSTEWLAKRFNMDVVILIRHPAAFVSSVKRMNWPLHDFSQFLKQPLLMRDHLYPFKKEIEEFAIHEYDIIDQGILLWKMFYYFVNKLKRSHDDFIFVRHEDLSLNPIEEFRNLSKWLNIEFIEKIEKAILEYSNKSNPSEAPNGVLHQLKRDSISNIKNWKARLSKLEIRKIREGVQNISNIFYKDEDWE